GNEILTPIEMQDYQSIYLDLYQKLRQHKKVEKEDVVSDVVFETELVRQVDVNIDYILLLVERYRAAHGQDKTVLAEIRRAVNSSIELRSKKELIENFVESTNIVEEDVIADWKRYIAESRERDLQAVIEQENLRPQETREYMEKAFRDNEFRTGGTDLQDLMPRRSLFDDDSSDRTEGIIAKLKKFFEKYIGLVI
ncbi:MAG: type I restriction endonuclease subunit R, partial [Desulfovibrionaceae bacterium]|nr:type I restriction endonuclease subunit R [Desulfovibrionaceae bacterium]